MRRRRRHSVDLLPLLDVFMVVLFVFATIEEGRVDAAERTAAELQATVDELGRGRRDAASAAAELDAMRRAQADATRQHELEVERLRSERAELQSALAEVRADAERAAKMAAPGEQDVLRKFELLDKLQEQFSVFEVEIAGTLSGDDIVNRCCYRSDPLAGSWRPCGQVPELGSDIKDWLDEDGSVLVATFRQTKGGNALAVVRQDDIASTGVGRKLEEQLRERFPQHVFYNEGASPHAMACASTDPTNEPPTSREASMK